MDEEVLLILAAEGESATAVIGDIDESLVGLDETINEVAASAGELDGLEASLGGIAEASTGMDEALAGLTEALSQMAELIAEVNVSLEDLGASADSAASGINILDESAMTASGSLDEMGASANDAAASNDALGTSASGSTSKFGMLGLAIGAATVGMVVFGAQGTDALTRVQALTGASSAQMAQYQQAINAYAGTYGATVKNLAGGLYDIISVGYQGVDALDTLKVAAEAAAAGGVDLHTVTSGLTSIMKAFGVQGKNAASVMDVLLTGVRDGKASFLDFSNAIGLVAEAGHGAGFSLKETTAALATLTEVFPNARRAGMDLSHLITALGVNAATVAKNAKSMGLSFDLAKFSSMTLGERLAYLWQITHGNQAELVKLTGGVAGYAAAQVLMNNKGAEFARILKDMGKASGATANAFDQWKQSVGAAAEDAKGSLSVLAEQLVIIAGPAITGGLHLLSQLFTNLTSWISKNGQIALPILGTLAAMLGGTLVAAIGALAAPVLAAAADFAPFILAIGAVVAIAIGAVKLFQHWMETNTGFHNTVVAVGNAVRTYLAFAIRFMRAELNFLLPILQRVGQFLMTHLHDAVAIVGPKVQEVAGAIGGFAVQVGQRLGPVIQIWAPRIEAFAKLAIAGIGRELHILQTIWNAAWPEISTVLRTAWGIIQGVVKIGWAEISGIVKVGLDILSGNWKGAWSDLRDMTKGITAGIKQVVDSVMHGIEDSVINMAHGILDALSHVPGPIGDMARKGEQALDDLKTKTSAVTAEMAAQTAQHLSVMHQEAAYHFDQMRLKLISEIQRTKDPVKKHALEMKLAVVTNMELMHLNAAKHAREMEAKATASAKAMHEHVAQHSQDMKTRVLSAVQAMASTAVTDVQTGFTNLKNKAKQLWDQMVANIKATIQGGFNWVKQHIQQAVQTVVGWFSWLYNHNYYFQHLVDFIHQKIDEIKAKFDQIKQTLTRIWNDLWTGVTSRLQQAWTSITSRFDQGKKQATGKVNDLKASILGVWNNLWSTVEKLVGQAWGNVQKQFNTAKTQLGKIVDDLTHNSIVQKILSIGPAMLNAGKHLMQMLIDGIKNMAGAVGNEAKNVAQNIAKFLGFHSPTEEGPGSTADQWMPALGAMLEQGLRAQVAKLKAASSAVAGAITGGIGGATASAGVAGLGGLSGAGGASGGASGGGSQAALLSAILGELQAGNSAYRAAALGSPPVSATTGAITQQFSGGINLYGISNPATLFNILNELAGLAQENGLRGATLGLAQ